MKHIKEFDGLRGLLATWVVLAHVFHLGHLEGFRQAARAEIAVDVFIILSGFVIFNLLDRGETCRAFITRRFFRLFPAFFLSLIFCAVLSEVLPMATPEAVQDTFYVENNRRLVPHLLAHLTMLNGAVPDQILPGSSLSYLPPAWSVSLEWQFYLLAPFLFAFFTRPNFRLALVVGLVVGIRALSGLQLLGPPFLPPLTFGSFNAFLPLKLELFLVGGVSCFVWKWLIESRGKLPLPADGLALLLAAMVQLLTHRPAVAIWAGLFLLLVGIHSGQPAPLARAVASGLDCRPLQWLGTVSYSLYLVHWPVLVLVRFGIERIFPQSGPVASSVLLGVLGFALALCLAGIMYRRVEKPFMDYARELTNRWPAGKLPAAATSENF